MSKTIARVVDGFFKGWQLGLQGMHYEDMRADRREQREIARATAAQRAQQHRERMALDSRKADAYIEQAQANAARLRAKAAGGGGKGAGGPSSEAAGFLDDMTQVGLDVSVPERQPTYVTVQPDDSPSVGEPPASSTVTEDAHGGKIPAAARGGTMRRIGGAMAGAMTSGANAVMRREASQPSGPVGPITRRSSTQTYPGQVQPPVPGGAGTSGPGSGYGDNAAPPVTAQPMQASPPSYQTQAINPQTPTFDPTVEGTYRRGGRVRKFAEGGGVADAPAWNTMPKRGRWSNPISAFGASGAPDAGGWDANAWWAGKPTRPPDNRSMWAAAGDQGTYRGPTHDIPPPDYGDPVTSDTMPPDGGGAPNGGGGAQRTSAQPYTPRGGMLGDQRRTTAYDPVADRMDPRNIGIVNDQGATNPMVQAATRHGGIELTHPSQAIFRRGGPVRRYQQGGEVVIGPDGYPVPVEPRWQPQHDWAREGAMEQIRQRRLERNVTGQPGSEDQTVPPPYVSEEDQQRSAAEARNPNPSVRNWVPPTRRPQSGFVGEEARADERPYDQPQPPQRPDPYMHDESRGEPLQSYPDAGGAPAPRRGGNGAISTRPPQRLQLGDQRRTAAYDPEADRMDPRNTGIVEPGGAVNERVYRGLQTPKGDNVGPFGDRLDKPGPTPEPARASDYATAATSYAEQQFGPAGQQGRSQVYNGAGSPDPRTVQQLLQVIDPKGQMPIGDRIQYAAQSAYQFHKEQGNEQEAQKAAFEITQYGVGKSREHGVAAVKMAQGGNLQGAVEELTKGYEWLPNGQRAIVQNNQIVVLGKDGKQVMALPLDPKSIQNLAMGMATGQLGWDVMRQAGSPTHQSSQPPPGATRPAAQPTAAPAGPATPPAAPPTQRPAAPTQPLQAVQTTAPTAAPTGPPRPTQTAAPPPAPARPAPSQTTAPPQRGGPSTPAKTAAPSTPAPKTPAQGDGGEITEENVEQKTQEWYAKHPDKPPPWREIARETAQDPRDQQVKLQHHREALTKRYADERAWIIKRAQERGLKKGDSKYLTEALKTHKSRYDAMFKEIDDQSKAHRTEQNAQDRYDRENTLKPRQVTYDQEELIKKQINDRMDQQTKDKQFKAANTNTVLRYQMTPTQRTEFTQLAKELWRQNPHLTAERAHDLAIAMTAIKPDGEGLNGQKGKDALQYRVEAGNARRGYRVTTRNGERLNVDHNAHRQLRQIQLENWDHYERKKGEADKDKEEFGKRTKNLAIRLAPILPPPLGSIIGGSSTLVK